MKCLKPNIIDDGRFKNFNQRTLTLNPNAFMIPCNNCFNCKINKSKSWAVRCLLESYEHKYNYFITLTYSDDKLKFVENSLNEKTGEFKLTPTLYKKDVQDFIKRFRRHLNYRNQKNFKYLVCGEYGDKTNRPHYHMLMFSDTEINDLVYYKKNSDGDAYWTSSTIEKLWGHGYCVIADFTPQTAAYTARYTLKKINGTKKHELYDSGLIKKQQEFLLCSKKPAIGWTFFNKNKDLFIMTDYIAYNAKGKLNKAKIPTSFLKKLHESEIANLKLNRKKAARVSFINYLKINKELDYLKLLDKELYISQLKQEKLKQRVF